MVWRVISVPLNKWEEYNDEVYWNLEAKDDTEKIIQDLKPIQIYFVKRLWPSPRINITRVP